MPKTTGMHPVESITIVSQWDMKPLTQFFIQTINDPLSLCPSFFVLDDAWSDMTGFADRNISWHLFRSRFLSYELLDVESSRLHKR